MTRRFVGQHPDAENQAGEVFEGGVHLGTVINKGIDRYAAIDADGLHLGHFYTVGQAMAALPNAWESKRRGGS